MFAGGVLSWLVLLPMMSIMGAAIPTPFPPITPANALNPATGQPFLISEMSPAQIWSAYIRYIGAGAVLAAGLITLGRTLPTIVSSAREGLKGFGVQTGGVQARTERDIPMAVVLAGSLALAIFLAIMPGLPTQGNLLVSVLVIVFGFFFATVSSRITGLIGSSSNPISGMTIATLIITCIIFVAIGWNDSVYAPVALSVGAIICICAANAGNTSQDLKTGYIVGATPLYQQLGLAIGVIASSFVIGWTLLQLHNTFGIGSAQVAAPQATLMATLIRGLLDQQLPWGLVLVGVFLALALEICGVRSLPFAVGSYLPIATTAPIFLGGLVRYFVEQRTGVTSESELSSGTLFSSGLIAGGSLTGILFALLYSIDALGPFQAIGGALPFLHGDDALGHIAGAVFFLVLAVILYRAGQRRIE
jgi:putative OPT family oligopeptide transporter